MGSAAVFSTKWEGVAQRDPFKGQDHFLGASSFCFCYFTTLFAFCGPRLNSRLSTYFACTLPSSYIPRHNPSFLYNSGTSFLCIFYHRSFIVFEKLGANIWLPCFTEWWRFPFTAREGTQSSHTCWTSALLLSCPSSWKRPSHVLLGYFSHSVLVGNYWRIRLHWTSNSGVDTVTFFYFEWQNYTLCLWREQLGIQLDLRSSEAHWFSV